MDRRAVVLLSGGLDSATTLAVALERGFECHTLAIGYGQRHSAELDAAARVSRALGAASHRRADLPADLLRGSALTDPSIAVPEDGGPGIPVTYVPARNTVFLSIALGTAEQLRADAIFIGVNAVDYSGYPDCRPEFIAAFQALATLATKQAVEGSPVAIEAPLITSTKAEIIALGMRLGVDYAVTVSCYSADPQGRACARCDACRLRAAGFAAAGIPDPTRYQAARADV